MSNMVNRLERNRKERMARARKAYQAQGRELKERNPLHCPTCGEELADPLLPCGFCEAEANDPGPVAA